MSPVTVDLFFFRKASDAAFLSIVDPAMHPKTVGFLLLRCDFESADKICLRAHDRKTPTLHQLREKNKKTSSSNCTN